MLLKKEELPPIPATLIRKSVYKSVYLPFFFSLKDQDVTVMRRCGFLRDAQNGTFVFGP